VYGAAFFFDLLGAAELDESFAASGPGGMPVAIFAGRQIPGESGSRNPAPFRLWIFARRKSIHFILGTLFGGAHDQRHGAGQPLPIQFFFR